LWTATGSGAAARRTLGTVVVSGMLAATMIAIFIIPVLFVVVERLAIRKPVSALSSESDALNDGSAS
jgi:HAE1 family hydrophobic/amphiphilic exporter-1